MNGDETISPTAAVDALSEGFELEVDKWVREVTLRAPAPPAPAGWHERVRAALAGRSPFDETGPPPAYDDTAHDDVDSQLAIVKAYDSALRTLACHLLDDEGPVDVREVDTLCVETWVTVFRTLPPEHNRRSPLTWILEVMRTRYTAFARQEMWIFRAASWPGQRAVAHGSIDGGVGEVVVPPSGDHYVDSVRGRLEIDRMRRMVHEGLPLAVAISRLDGIRQWAAEMGLRSVEAEACIEISKALRHQGQLSPARRPAFRGLRLGTRANDHRLMILANFELSMMSSGLDDGRYIRRMVDLGAEHAPGFWARVCYSRARSEWKLGNLLEAVDLLRRSLELYAEVGDTYGYARAEVRFGCYLRRAGVFEQAETHLSNALSMAKAERYRRVEGYALLRLAILRRVLKYEQHVEPMMMEALGVFREIGDVPGEAQALGSLARLYRQQRRFDEAIDHAKRCLEACEGLDDVGVPHKRISMATAVAYRRLWKCYRDAGQLPAVVAVLDSANERYRSWGDHFGQALLMALMAEVLVAEGNRDDAEALARRVETILSQPTGGLYSGSTEEDMDENPRTLFDRTITCLAHWSEGIVDAQAFLSADQIAEVKRSQAALHESRWLVHEALQADPVVALGVTDMTELVRV